MDTYGCQMNVHDSEKIAGILKEKGYKPADDISQADIIIFNTCCIRETAEKKIFGSIGNT
ncbi:MAG: tRNA (N6-isopentenyl adenosine(37)-C2)-methylthiotransferase MiaB, partial [Christensenellales bacterium]